MKLMGTPFSEQLPTAQLHWMIADKEECIVVESMKDGMHIYDDPVGVLTNNPPFPVRCLHLTILQVYPESSRKVHLQECWSWIHTAEEWAEWNSGRSFKPVKICKGCIYKTKCNIRRWENESVSQFFHILGSVDQQRDAVSIRWRI